MTRSLLALVAMLQAVSLQAAELLVPRQQFDPGGSPLRVFTSAPADPSLRLDIFTPDGDLVRTLAPGKLPAPGEEAASAPHAFDDRWQSVFSWDGRDAAGGRVPNEVYVPVLSRREGDERTVLADPRSWSGGELVQPTDIRLDRNGTVQFGLPEPARVLVRVGVAGGPLVSSPLQWAVRPAGANRVSWNGRDASGAHLWLGDPRVRVLVLAHALADHSIMVVGRDAMSYQAYRKRAGLPQDLAPREGVLERNGQHVLQAYWLPRAQAREPEVHLQVVTEGVQASDGVVVVDRPVTLSVSMSEEDAYVMALSQYEIAFFVDHDFFAEEETGYVPLQWQLRPGDLSPGEHVVTVNVSGLWGHVGVAAMNVRVADEATESAGE